MTKIEAYNSMKTGSKVKHKYFTNNEFLHMVDGIITNEEDYNFESWWNGKETWKETGWSITD